MRSRLPLEALLLRPNLGVGAALMLLTVFAWLQLVAYEPGATGPVAAHSVHAGAVMMHAAPRAWQAVDVGVTLLMWLVMAVAMMLPTAAPAILSFADICRGADRLAPAADRVGAFVGGYLAVWSGFGVLATAAQWALAAAALGTPGFRAGGPLFGGALLVAAGLYQFSALKDLCLTQCRSPLAFFIAHWREGTRGALYLGLRHGIHCVGCCWALMALMLIGGTMNLAWTATLAVLMLAEKVAPGGRFIGRTVGVGLIAWGGALLLSI